jgi:hypothetical protein
VYSWLFAIVLVTDQGKTLLLDRFSAGFDERRKTRADAFKGRKTPPHQVDEDEESVPPVAEEFDTEFQPAEKVKRTKDFVPTRDTTGCVCHQIR